jgi:hypothetical protein
MAIAIRIAPSFVPSFAVAASPMLFISLAKTIPVTPSDYNPHSASPARAFVQSGLQ